MNISKKNSVFFSDGASTMLSRKSHVSQKLTQQFPKTGMQYRLSRHGLGNIIQQLIPEFNSEFFKNHQKINRLHRTFFTYTYS
jgi:hypothetical protein